MRVLTKKIYKTSLRGLFLLVGIDFLGENLYNGGNKFVDAGGSILCIKAKVI